MLKKKKTTEGRPYKWPWPEKNVPNATALIKQLV